MLNICKEFLKSTFKKIKKDDGSFVYNEENIFFDEAKRDYFKDNDYGVVCIIGGDRKQKSGQITGRKKIQEKIVYVRKLYERRLIFRCIILSKKRGEVSNFIDQFEKIIAEQKQIRDEIGGIIQIDLNDATYPSLENERLKRRPFKAISRIEFIGGIYKIDEYPFIKNITINPII